MQNCKFISLTITIHGRLEQEFIMPMLRCGWHGCR